MAVDFSLRKTHRYRVASIVRVGPWKPDNLRTEFGELVRWATKRKVPTGRWIFLERDRNRWEACLEIKREAETDGRIRLKTLPASWAARVVFDPDRVSSRLVYHGLSDWTRSRRRAGDLRSVEAVREVYAGDPWNDKNAWAHCEVQFVVRK